MKFHIRDLDVSSIAGLLVGASCVAGGLLLEGGKLSDILQLTAALIVLGGTAGAVLITTPFPLVLAASKQFRSIFWHPPVSLDAAITQLLSLATKARRSGIVSLESQLKLLPDPFLRKALTLAVDGADSKTVREIMQLEIQGAENQSDAEARVFECAGGYAPTIGIIGAVLGLIQVMKHLGDMEAVGHGIAVAFVATIYGVSISNLFLLPAASKLRARSAALIQHKELVLEGILAMLEGLHPFLIESKLEAFQQTRNTSIPAKTRRSIPPVQSKAARGLAG